MPEIPAEAGTTQIKRAPDTRLGYPGPCLQGEGQCACAYWQNRIKIVATWARTAEPPGWRVVLSTPVIRPV